ncbi:MAG: flagellar protein FlgN [Deltaproteobacteria bacterium]|nr:flagellar protein FlgN [Deltaproteobacteria bacterium]
MDLLLNKFLGLLEGETALYRSLLLVFQKEERAVVDSKLKELNETSKEKENLVLKIRILEEERVRMVERLAELLGYSPQLLTLTKLSQLVEEPYSTRLKDCCSNLSALIQSVQEANQANKALLTHSLELVKGSLALLNNLMPSNPVYYRGGKIQINDQGGKVVSSKI